MALTQDPKPYAANAVSDQGSADLRTATSLESESQAPAGTSLVHFGMVSEGVYKGSKPKTDADYEFLKAHRIRFVLDLELLPSLRHSEEIKAKRYGMVLLQGRINASPISPSEKHVEKILAVLNDRRYRPIYFHCAYGRDRTSLIAALYKMYFLGMSQQDALRYMDDCGYKNSWVRSGLKRYLRKHSRPGRIIQSDRSRLGSFCYAQAEGLRDLTCTRSAFSS